MSSNFAPVKARDSGQLHLKRTAKRLLARHLQRVCRRVMRLAGNKGKRVERIHELRTELRRSEAACKLFANFVPHGLTERIQQVLARLRSMAGSVRDRDVLKLGLDEFDQKLSLEFRHWLKQQLHRTRERKLKGLIRYCRRITEQGFEVECRVLIDAIDWPEGNHNQIRKQFLCDALARIADPFLCAVQQLKQDERKFHQLRICGRRLRYTIDLLHDDLPESAGAQIGDLLSKLQSWLGQAHDQTALLQYIQLHAAKSALSDASLTRLLESLEREYATSLQLWVRQSVELGDQLPKLLDELTDNRLEATRLEEGVLPSS